MKNSPLTTCLVCGGQRAERVEEEREHQLTLGDHFFAKGVFFRCKDCTEEISADESDKNFLAAQKIAEHKFVKKSIEQLVALGISMAYFERVFELPIRTLTRWKTGDFSATSVAFLRILITYPWMTKVAEQSFHAAFAEKAIVMAAQKVTAHENGHVFASTAGNSIISNASVSISMQSGV